MRVRPGSRDRGHAAVPVDFYKDEYKRRRLRARMQLSMNGCLGPCSMANAVLLVFDGRSVWFQSINHAPQIVAVIGDHVVKHGVGTVQQSLEDPRSE